ncbi:uncharacterized protein Tco025E_04423 [Trypanosoma conorhini]|uniref:Uncharacterized protein n=1 Tax=Trypanosoma conorhini TaxID=83891 RepID=A0A3R7NHC4_9TRYP|nr:uncharacterized protein Tco025E_04423 [Trypanosoma conorhini]RNF18549.1 hypothetical protein Tco025E_04423 [Trypanosoma conorhini]
MTAGFGLGRVLIRLVCGTRDEGGCCDVAMFDATMRHTVGWYAVAGSAAVAVVPVLYVSLYVLAGKRKTLILRTAHSLSHLPADLSADSDNAACSPFLPTPRAVLALRRVLDAERATDVEFAKVFSSELVNAYVDVVFRGLLRSCCRHCMFHVSVFLVCTVLATSNDRVVGDASSSSSSIAAADTAMSGSLLDFFRQMWSQLRHGALLRCAVEGVSTPYAFFNFSLSSPRMLERCFPWIGTIHYAVSHCAIPGVCLFGRWRSPDAADRVWRVMTPKGFAAMWCCRCLSDLFQPNYSATKNDTAEYSLQGGGGERHTSCRVLYSGDCNGVDTEREQTHKETCKVPLPRSLIPFVLRTGRTSTVVFAVTSYASRTNLSWLPFPCAGGPQYVALCYTEMALLLIGLSFAMFRRAVDHSLRQRYKRHAVTV